METENILIKRLTKFYDTGKHHRLFPHWFSIFTLLSFQNVKTPECYLPYFSLIQFSSMQRTKDKEHLSTFYIWKLFCPELHLHCLPNHWDVTRLVSDTKTCLPTNGQDTQIHTHTQICTLEKKGIYPIRIHQKQIFVQDLVLFFTLLRSNNFSSKMII